MNPKEHALVAAGTEIKLQKEKNEIEKKKKN